MIKAKGLRVEVKRRRAIRFLSGQQDDDVLDKHLGLRLQHDGWIPRPLFRIRRLRSASHIRLFYILPDSIGAEIRCELREYDFNVNDLRYDALSYVWGDPSACLTIVCNGSWVPVTINLYSALLRLRKAQTTTAIWVDALCIDQDTKLESLQERATQIRMMDKIYSRADYVFVDLGGANAEDIKCLSVSLKRYVDFTETGLPRNRENKSTKEAMSELNDVLFLREMYTCLTQRPWFRRVWVVQEFVLAKTVAIMIGTLLFSVEVLHAALTEFCGYDGVAEDRHGRSFLQRFNESGKPTNIQMDRNPFRGLVNFIYTCVLRSDKGAAEPLLETTTSTLDHSQGLDATDERDYVYGILGLIPDLSTESFHVSYEESPGELAIRLSKVLIAKGYGRYCLARAGGVRNQKVSWAFSLGSHNLWFQRGADGLITLRGDFFSRIFHASGASSFSVHVNSGSNILSIRGGQVDEIRNVFKAPYDENQSLPSYDGLAIVLHESLEWAFKEFKHQNSKTLQDTYWRTMLMDCVKIDKGDLTTEDRAPADLSQPCRAWESKCSMNKCEGKCDIVSSNIGKMAMKGEFRRLCRTTNDRMAYVPREAKTGDEVWILFGISVPFVLRRAQGGHILVGPCYVHGLMDGEALELPTWKPETVQIK